MVEPELLLVQKHGAWTFPPTKFRPEEDLYQALARPMEEDLGLPPGSYFPEKELKAISSSRESPAYQGLSNDWYLYPVVVSLTEEGWQRVQALGESVRWLSPKKVLEQATEPNVRAIAEFLCEPDQESLGPFAKRPSMDALASHWAASQAAGFRLIHGEQVRRILDSGDRAFNLRVADPYLPYQRQGLGFTWSFFTPKDKQDVHVHGLPAVEIYGVMEGRLQIWFKPMHQRGVRTWHCRTLAAGDWAEVEPLQCHFACWLEPHGLGTVVKAAGSGELAGVGRLGASGKTTCEHCSSQSQCVISPVMQELMLQYSRPYPERDYRRIAELAEAEEIR